VFGALGFTSGIRHYQHLLGYELRHVIPARPRRARRRRRLLVSLLAGAASAVLIVPPIAESAMVDKSIGSIHLTRPHETAGLRDLPVATHVSSPTSRQRGGADRDKDG
jgi:hypothetical protein